MRNCTFSLAAKAAPSITLARRTDVKATGKTQTWFSRTYVRGPSVTLLDSKNTSAALLIEESLFAGQDQPVLQFRGDGEDTLDLRILRSTLVARPERLCAGNRRTERGPCRSSVAGCSTRSSAAMMRRRKKAT